MARICNKCHRIHDQRTACPKPPTLKQMQIKTEQYLKTLHNVTNQKTTSATRYGSEENESAGVD